MKINKIKSIEQAEIELEKARKYCPGSKYEQDIVDRILFLSRKHTNLINKIKGDKNETINQKD